MSSSEDFRDTIATVDEDGKKVRIFPKRVKGKYNTARRWVGYFLLLFLFAAPWIKVGGQPLLLLDVLGRKFSIFGAIFNPSDSFLFALAMIIGVVSVIVFTVAFGRIFCGWICPQTIFLEQVYRRIEYWIDGDRNQQMRLKRMGWTAEKIRKRVLKNIIFYFIAFLVSNVFLQYLIGSDKWLQFVTDGPAQHLGTFTALIVFSVLFYLVFAWFREQACIAVCPYGRLQGVLLDKSSIVILYDWIRGEPRKKGKRKETDPKVGDCVDCGLCVQVCPTGIDIRNGTQLECVNCTACIDVCDEVMEKVDLPKGLIRFDSTHNVESGNKRVMTPRLYAYIGILLALLSFFTFLVSTRSEAEVIWVRLPGKLYEKTDSTYINAYNYTVLNKTDQAKELEILLESHEGFIIFTGGSVITLDPEEIVHGAAVMHLYKDQVKQQKEPVKLIVKEGDVVIDEITTNFMGPRPRRGTRN